MSSMGTHGTALGLLLLGLLAGTVRGFAGFGAGLVLAPVLLVMLGPRIAVPAMLLLDIGASLYLLPGAIKNWRSRLVLPLSGSASAMFPIGALMLVRLDPSLVTQAVGVLVVGMALLLAAGWRFEQHPSRPALASTGALSGLLSGFGGIGGPPVVFLLMSTPGRLQETRADIITHFAILRVTALITFAVLGLFSLSLLGYLIVIGPAFATGTVLGNWMIGKSNDSAFRLACLLLMLGSGTIGILG